MTGRTLNYLPFCAAVSAGENRKSKIETPNSRARANSGKWYAVGWRACGSGFAESRDGAQRSASRAANPEPGIPGIGIYHMDISTIEDTLYFEKRSRNDDLL